MMQKRIEKLKLRSAKQIGTQLYVAVEGAVGDWACYEGSAKLGVEKVADYGDKTSEKEARELFPEFKGLRWRP